MRILSLLTLVLLGLAVGAGPVAAKGGVYEGRYVRVDGAVDAKWLEIAAELGDALFVRLARDLGRSPEKGALPLRLTLYPDRASFEKEVLPLHRRLKQAGTHEVAGGWTRWDPCTSFVWLQADAFDSRRLILHELVHQFYARCRERSRRGHGAFWYREGLAQYYGWHRRTKQGLQFGAFDAATRSLRMNNVRLLGSRKTWSAHAVASGARKAAYDDAIALVGALRGMEDKELRARFQRFESEVLTRGGGAKTFARLFAGRAQQLDAAVRDWWEHYERPWAFGQGVWDERDGYLVADPHPLAIATKLSRPRSWQQATVEISIPKGSRASAGLLVSYGEASFSFELTRGRLTVLKATRAMESCAVPVRDSYRLSFRLAKDGVMVTVVTDEGETQVVLSGKTLGLPEVGVLGDVSLIARGGRARFRGLRFEAAARRAPK